MIAAMDVEVQDNPDRSRYEGRVDGALVAILDYRMDGQRAVLPHTEVTQDRRGQGIGEQLVRAALDDLRSRGCTIVPACWFVAQFVEANPEYADLLAA